LQSCIEQAVEVMIYRPCSMVMTSYTGKSAFYTSKYTFVTLNFGKT